MARKAFKLQGTSVNEPGRGNFVFENFQGVDIISDNTALPKKMVPYAKNVDFSKRIGAASKRDGIVKLFNSLGVGGCIGIHNYRSAAGDRVLFGWGNTLYKLAGTSSTLTKTEQADWQAGTGYNANYGITIGSIALDTAPSNTFTRNTPGYNSEGVKVTNNIPRYDTALFDKGILIEEAATNLLTNPLFATDLTGWSNASATNWSYGMATAIRMTDGGAVGSTYAKIGDGTNNSKGIATTNNISVTAGANYNLSFYWRATNAASI